MCAGSESRLCPGGHWIVSVGVLSQFSEPGWGVAVGVVMGVAMGVLGWSAWLPSMVVAVSCFTLFASFLSCKTGRTSFLHLERDACGN